MFPLAEATPLYHSGIAYALAGSGAIPEPFDATIFPSSVYPSSLIRKLTKPKPSFAAPKPLIDNGSKLNPAPYSKQRH